MKLIVLILFASLVTACDPRTPLSLAQWCAGTNPEVHKGKCDGVDYSAETEELGKKKGPISGKFN